MSPLLASSLRSRGLRLRRPPLSPLLILLSRSLHTTSLSAPELDISHPTCIIWGANTGVGKTLVSAGLAASVLSEPLSAPASPNPTKFFYIKPVQTGFPQDSDARFVYRKVSDIFRRRRRRHRHGTTSPGLLASNHVLKASIPAAREVLGVGTEQSDELEGPRGGCWYEETRVRGMVQEEEGFKLVCKTLYGWKEAISPHLAVKREGMAVDDSTLRDVLQWCLGSSLGGKESEQKGETWRIIETAGGVASPGPSGTLQCDLYRSFRLPAVLVGDGRLGGISTTISAYESLKLRGYDVIAVILEDHYLSNEVSLLSYLRNRVHVLVLPPVPEDPMNNLMEWFSESSKIFSSFKELMLSSHLKRIHRLHIMPKKAGEIFWWPFTQHKLVPEDSVTVIDSRFGENFAIHKVCNGQEMIVPQFDACASWWTQGPDATLQIELAREMGYSTARYGHVMFPENVYEPALQCAELLLEGVGKGWASRTFYSDNGSTAVEVALKMAFRKFSFDHGICLDSDNGISSQRCIEFKVLALRGSYHGDTLGAMEAQAPSAYTGFLQQPWYSGRGLFLDPPTVFICNKIWKLSMSDALLSDHLCCENMRFSSCHELFCQSRDSSALARTYSAYIAEQLLQFSATSCSTRIGALIIEPVIQGAGGMHMIDPLFQRILVKECQVRKIPVVFDEVFTGFWRLGRESAAELLGCFPDVACFAKLLTGGIIPLAVTLTTEAVFEAFKGDSKLMALLHGHSYSAHAMGCSAAAKAMQWFKDPCTNLNIEVGGNKLKELWDMKIVLQMSSLPTVERVVTLGTLCAIELRVEGSDTGYASLCVSPLVQQLRADGIYMRPLGNVIYLMCGPCTSPHFCSQQLNKVYQRICEFGEGCTRGKQATDLCNNSA